MNLIADLEIPDWLAELRAEHERHAETCTAWPCRRCGRYVCPDCGERADGDDERACPPCAERRERSALAARWARTVPPAHAAASLDAPWLRELLGAAVLARVEPSALAKRVTLAGPPGTGKTSLAVALLRREFDVAGDVAFFTAVQLGKARAMHRLGDGEAPIVRRALEVRTLVLDEFGAEAAAHSPTVAEVIHERHADDKRTIVTTGLASDELGARYGGGILRRLTEGATALRLGRAVARVA